MLSIKQFRVQVLQDGGGDAGNKSIEADVLSADLAGLLVAGHLRR